MLSNANSKQNYRKLAETFFVDYKAILAIKFGLSPNETKAKIRS